MLAFRLLQFFLPQGKMGKTKKKLHQTAWTAQKNTPE
jgi:hypothetical protein